LSKQIPTPLSFGSWWQIPGEQSSLEQQIRAQPSVGWQVLPGLQEPGEHGLHMPTNSRALMHFHLSAASSQTCVLVHPSFVNGLQPNGSVSEVMHDPEPGATSKLHAGVFGSGGPSGFVSPSGSASVPPSKYPMMFAKMSFLFAWQIPMFVGGWMTHSSPKAHWFFWQQYLVHFPLSPRHVNPLSQNSGKGSPPQYAHRPAFGRSLPTHLNAFSW